MFQDIIFDDDELIDYMDDILSYIKLNGKVCNAFKYSNKLFDELYRENRYDLLFEFDYSLITNEFIKNNITQILNYLSYKKSIPKVLSNNVFLFEELLKEKKYDLLLDFSGSLVTDEFINNNFELIIDYLLNSNKVPYVLHNNRLVFDKLEELNRIDLCMKFSNKEFITDDFIKKNIDGIINYLDSLSHFSFQDFLENRFLFNEMIDNGRLDLAFFFDESFMDDTFIENNIDIIINYLEKVYFFEISLKLRNNEKIFNAVVNRRLDLAFLFDGKFFSDKFFEDNFDEICSLIEKSFFILNPYIESFDFSFFVQLLIENNRIDLISNLGHMKISDDVIDQYFEKFVDFIRNNGLSFSLFGNSLGENFKLFKYFMDVEEYDIASQFHVAFSEGFLNENFDNIILKNNGKILPNFNSKDVLIWVLKNKKYNLLEQFSGNIFDQKIVLNFNIYSIIKNELDGNVPFNLLSSICVLIQVLDNEDYEMAIKFYNQSQFLENESFRRIYAHKLGISKVELDDKINYLLSKNDEVLDTVNLQLFGNKYKNMSMNNLEYFAPYIDIQERILGLDDRFVDLFVKIINYLDGSKYDVCPIINNFLNNYSSYNDLLNSIDINNLSEEKFHNLLIIMQNNDNYLNITDINELDNNNFNILKYNYFKEIENKISNNTIDIEELRKKIFLKRLGMNMEQVKFLINRYCMNMDLLIKSDLPKKDIRILNSINDIYNCDDMEQLKFYFIGGIVHNDFYSAVSLESRIRKNFAKMYSDSLYKIDDTDKVDSNMFLDSSYNGIKPDFYVLKDDFNLQIHVLGAYSFFEVPDNFKDDWNKPKIASHGICTSYIGNNQIANARDSKAHPVYGFSSYEDSALLLEGNLDLVSRNANMSFATSYASTYNNAVFFAPNDLIDYTRHTHNEVVIERRNLDKNNSNFKRMPDYVVYIVDDINNKDNFSMDNSYYKETVQAAIDHDIPIVIVDRLYYAKRENEKCNMLLDSINNNKEFDKIDELVVTYMNNMAGCREYDKKREYNNYFTINGFDEIYNKFINEINDVNMDLVDKKKMVLNLYLAILREYNKITVENNGINKDNFYDLLHFDKKVEELKNISNQLGMKLNIEFDKVTNEDDNNIDSFYNLISTYYYNSSDEIKLKIYEDRSNGLSNQEIINKINNREYENMDRSK